MKRCPPNTKCVVCGRPATRLSHLSPDSYLRERREGARVIRENHAYCEQDYDRIVSDFWKRVRRHLA
jgi:hypothetical protein